MVYSLEYQSLRDHGNQGWLAYVLLRTVLRRRDEPITAC
jgi:hypothetical protein